MNPDNVEVLAKRLIKEHHLTGWHFRFIFSRRTFGKCRYTIKTICISKPLAALNSFERVTNTLLHEIAHALVGAGVGHGWAWKNKAVAIGCDGKTCYESHLVNQPEPTFIGQCYLCGVTFKRFRRLRGAGHCGVPLAWRHAPQIETVGGK